MRLEGSIPPGSEGRSLIQRINEKLATIYGALIKVPREVRILQTSAAQAGDSFVVAHNLGVVPDDFDYSVPVDTRMWATEDDKRSWTESSMRVRCGAASIVCTVVPKSWR